MRNTSFITVLSVKCPVCCDNCDASVHRPWHAATINEGLYVGFAYLRCCESGVWAFAIHDDCVVIPIGFFESRVELIDWAYSAGGWRNDWLVGQNWDAIKQETIHPDWDDIPF